MHVTVLMPAYNAERYVAEAAESVLTQTHEDFELLIIDDGSTDGTLPILRSFEARDGRVRVVASEHLGLCGVLNRGLQMASTEWVAIMHADDVMLPNRLERQVDFIGRHPEVSVASSFVQLIDGAGQVVGEGTSKLTTRRVVRSAVRRNELIGFHHPAVLMRKSAAQEAGGYRQAYWPAEDLDLWNRIVERGHDVLVQPEALVQYRIHDAAASIAHTQLQIQKLRFLRRNMRRRRRGREELTWDQFLQLRRERPLRARLKEARQDRGHLFYKRAASSFTSGELPTFAANLIGAFVLTPVSASKKVFAKYVKPRLERASNNGRAADQQHPADQHASDQHASDQHASDQHASSG